MGDKPGHWDRRDVEQMLRLANALHEHRGGGVVQAARLKAFLEGVCALIDAAAGVLVVGNVETEHGRVQWQPPLRVQFVGVDAATAEAVAVRSRHDGTLPDPALEKLLRTLRRGQGRASRAPLTLTRRLLLRNDRRGLGDAVRDVTCPAGIYDSLYSARVLEAGSVACVCAYRLSKGQGPFAAHDCQTVDVVHRECAWIYRDPVAWEAVRGLDPEPARTGSVLQAAVRAGGKADRPGNELSRNTIHHYVKAIYKRLRVSSRGELLVRWMRISPDP